MTPTAEKMVRDLLGQRVFAAAEEVEKRRKRARTRTVNDLVHDVANKHDTEHGALRHLFGIYDMRDEDGRFCGCTTDPAEGAPPDDPDELTALAISRWME